MRLAKKYASRPHTPHLRLSSDRIHMDGFSTLFFIMNFSRKTALVASFAAGLSVFHAAPSQAGVCTGDGTSNGSFALSLITTDPTLTCKIGDKTYSNFSYTGFVSSDPAQNVVNMSESGVGGLQHTIGMMNTSGWTSASNTFNYTITYSGSDPLVVLDKWAATSSSSIIGSGWDTTVAASNSAPSPVNGSGAFSTSGTPSVFNPNTKSSAFTNTFTVTNQGFTSFDNSLIQKQVPGPLSILGAGAAFGFSRKLRNRIKSAA